MKKSVLIIVNIILVIAVIAIFIIQSSAKTDISKGFDGNYLNSTFIDNTGLVENPDELTTLVQQTAQQLEMNICIYSAGQEDSYRSDSGIKNFADTSYDDTFGEDTDGVFYYMDVSGKSPACDHISTSGKAILMYQDNIDGIFTRLDNYLPASTEPVTAEHIENAVKCFLSALEDYSTYKSTFEYYYDSTSGKYMFMKNGEVVVSADKPPVYNMFFMLICLAIGAGIALITYFVIASNYKFKKSQNAVIYARNGNTVFRRKSDDFIRTYTTKHKIETSSGSSSGRSGGGGSHHSSSGGHGGGSHHR
ncbi:MAG: hypothetical protein K2G36_09095 [Ruminococcus sp.]|nr:hypothetical protein [Ruminococcus sp.]